MKKLLVLSLGIFLAFQVWSQELRSTSITINVRVTHGDPMFMSGPGSGWIDYEYFNPYASGYESESVHWGVNPNIVTISTAAAGHININYSPANERIWGCCPGQAYCYRFLGWEPGRNQTIYFSAGQTGTITVNFVATPTHLMQHELEHAVGVN